MIASVSVLLQIIQNSINYSEDKAIVTLFLNIFSQCARISQPGQIAILLFASETSDLAVDD